LIVKIRSLSSLAGALFALVAAAVLTSCGGGGAQANPETVVGLSINPSGGTIYAGVPFPFQILGGRTPYDISSSEPAVLPVPSQISSHSMELVAANPGVIDAGLKPEDLPVRTVNITVRSGDGQNVVAIMKVARNFLTGYGVVFTPLTCPIATTATSVQACAGGQTAVQFEATFNGNLFGNRLFRLDVVKGPYKFIFPPGGTDTSVTVQSDHTGLISAIFQVTAGVPTQLAVIRVTDVASGASANTVFTITGTANNGQLTAIPSTITFTGNLTTDCGTGSSSFFVFDGSPPFTALSSDPNITVNSTSSSNPGSFTVNANSNVPPCHSGTIVVQDSGGSRATVDVKSLPGTGTVPKPATFTVAPTDITLGCAESGSVSAVGGSGQYSTNSSSPQVTAVVSGSTVTITRAGPAGAGAGTLTTNVSVTDGATIQVVKVTSPATCP
jgi:hypothetical protein